MGNGNILSQHCSNKIFFLKNSYHCWDRTDRDSTIAVKVGANSYTWRMLYYDTGPMKKIVYPSTSTALKEGYSLNPRNFISVVADTFGASTVKFRNIYTYNQVGDRSSDSLKLMKPAGDSVVGKITWNYDNIRRLTATRYPSSIASKDSAIYAYDEMGNRTSKVSGGATTSYSYNLNNNELNSNGGSYTYDNNGNLIQKTLPNQSYYNYAYDFENRLVKAKYTLIASDSVRMEYDGMGQRRRKIGTSDTTRYTWDGLYPVVEWNNQGKLKQTLIYANGLLLGLIDSTLNTNRRFFVLHDGLGSSICMANDSARVVRSLIYSDFGSPLVDTSAANTPTLNRLYAGYCWDGSPANFYWMKYRQSYDPVIGRFGQEDPLTGDKAFPMVYNLYPYVYNNPITLTDPSGEKPCIVVSQSHGIVTGVGFMEGEALCSCNDCTKKIRFECYCYGAYAGWSFELGPCLLKSCESILGKGTSITGSWRIYNGTLSFNPTSRCLTGGVGIGIGGAYCNCRAWDVDLIKIGEK